MKAKIIAAGMLLSVILTLAVSSCKKQTFFAHDEGTLLLSAEKTDIALNENVRVYISGYNEDGSLMWDGTRVDLTISNGSLDKTAVELEDGKATVTASGDKGRGDMTITARSGTVESADDLVITVGAAVDVYQVVASLSPTILPYSGGRMEIVVRVYNESLDPIPNIGVILESSYGSLDSRGTRLLTDSNGSVTDFLQTVKACTVTIYAGDKTKTVQILLEDEPEPNDPPEAAFNYSPVNPYSNETIYFNASESTDSDGRITSYKWDFGDGTSGQGKLVEHSYDLQGLASKGYTVTLTVTDDQGAYSATNDVVMVSEKPEK